MRSDLFWLNETQFAKIASLLPTDTRGKPRVDDRRVISGIVQVLKSGGRWVDAPSEYGPKKTLYNRFVRWAEKRRMDGAVRGFGASWGPAGAGSHRFLRRQGAPLGERRKRGEAAQAIGRSRGGRTTKIHALTDAACRPLAFLLTGGQVADCTAGALLLERLPDCDIVHADKGYDAEALRACLENTVWDSGCFAVVIQAWDVEARATPPHGADREEDEAVSV